MIPVGGRITTDQTTCAQFDQSDCWAFAITAAMEGRSACTISAAFVAKLPVLVFGSNPGVDLQHLVVVDQRTSLEVVGGGTTLDAVVIRLAVVETLAVTSTHTTALTLVGLGASITVGALLTEITGVAIAVVTTR